MSGGIRERLAKDPLARAHLATVVMVIIGWSIAAVVYFRAAPEAEDPLRQFHESKKYQADVERFGGKATVFANDLTDWIASLFRGQTLALTIAVITIIVAFGYLLRASRSASKTTPDESK
jgi:hypothetical protein